MVYILVNSLHGEGKWKKADYKASNLKGVLYLRVKLRNLKEESENLKEY